MTDTLAQWAIFLFAVFLFTPCIFILLMLGFDFWKDSDIRRVFKDYRARRRWRRTLKFIKELPEVKK